MNRCDYSRIPRITREALDTWAQTARPGGGFVQAVIANDLRGAVESADEEHVDVLPVVVAYAVNRLPAACWGSQQRAADWRRRGGLRGIEAEGHPRAGGAR